MWAVLWQYDDKSACGVWCFCETGAEAKAIADALNNVASGKTFWATSAMEVSIRGPRGNTNPTGGSDAS